MKRFTKTTMIALAIVAGTISGAFAQKQWVRVDPMTKDQYRFTYSDDGKATLKVELISIAAGDSHQLKDVEEVLLKAKINKLKGGNAELILKGKVVEPVSVNIYDKKDVLLLAEFIDHGSNFSKVYDLSNMNMQDLRIEVSTGSKMLAALKF